VSKFNDGEFYGRGTECQFEPNTAPILCFECEKPTGETGTCTDSGLCPKCRAEYEELVGKEEVAELMVGVASGEHYYKPIRRAMHMCRGDGQPLCRVFTNKQPVTTNSAEVSCKRCLKLTAATTTKGNQP